MDFKSEEKATLGRGLLTSDAEIAKEKAAIAAAVGDLDMLIADCSLSLDSLEEKLSAILPDAKQNAAPVPPETEPFPLQGSSPLYLRLHEFRLRLVSANKHANRLRRTVEV